MTEFVLLKANELKESMFEWCLGLAISATKMSLDDKRIEMRLDKMQYLIIPQIGFASYMFDLLDNDSDSDDSDEVEEEVLYLYELHIQQELRGQGYGSILINKLKSMANNTRIVLTVSKSNASATEFYRKQGFNVDATCPSNYGIQDVDYRILSFPHN